MAARRTCWLRCHCTCIPTCRIHTCEWCDNLTTTKQQVKMGPEMQTPAALTAQFCCCFRFSPAPGSAGHMGGCLLWWQLTVIPVQHQFETFKCEIFQIPPPVLKLDLTLVKEQFLLCHFTSKCLLLLPLLQLRWAIVEWSDRSQHLTAVIQAVHRIVPGSLNYSPNPRTAETPGY